MSHNPLLGYRPDIDGLRAIAVLSVVLYHFGIGGLDGGFVGVDVFFVISGYLITGIIQKEIGQNSFTFSGFYERRARRILPALFAILVASLFFGYLIFFPSDFILVAKSTAATLFFGSNIFYWRTSGYFETVSDLNPLLHTWSLAVEEQFYILLPILLILIYRYARNYLGVILLSGTVISFIACLLIQQIRPDAAFYLTPFRAWELLIGSYISVGRTPSVNNSAVRESVAGLGALLLVLSIVLISESRDFPGYLALGPVLGTVFIIYSNTYGPTLVGRFLSFGPLVYIGLISYSLYLWHWPVLAFMRYLNALEPLNQTAYLGVIVSIIISIASYYLIETPFRKNKYQISKKNMWVGAASFSILMMLLVGLVISSGGVKSRFSKEVVHLDSQRNPFIPYLDCNENSDINRQGCILGSGTKNPEVVLWGDSHSLSIAPAIDKAYKYKKSVALAYKNACPPLLGISVPVSFGCHAHNSNVIKNIIENPSIKVVIIHAEWSEYINVDGKYLIKNIDINDLDENHLFYKSIQKTIKELHENKIHVVIIGPIPNAPNDLQLKFLFQKYKNSSMPDEVKYIDHLGKNEDFYRIFNAIRSNKNITFIDPAKYLCDGKKCTYIKNNQILYLDNNHLRFPGSIVLSQFLQTEISSTERSYQ